VRDPKNFNNLQDVDFSFIEKILHPHLNPLPQGGRGGGTHDILGHIGKRESLILETILRTLSLRQGRGQGEGSMF
jgi:hypothetical protein